MPALGEDGLPALLRRSESDRTDVRGLETLRPLRHVELDLLALGEGAEPLRLDGGVVAEDVVAAAVLRDEAETLRVIEPLHGTGSHYLSTHFLQFSSGDLVPPGPDRKWPGEARGIPSTFCKVQPKSGILREAFLSIPTRRTKDVDGSSRQPPFAWNGRQPRRGRS